MGGDPPADGGCKGREGGQKEEKNRHTGRVICYLCGFGGCRYLEMGRKRQKHKK